MLSLPAPGSRYAGGMIILALAAGILGLVVSAVLRRSTKPPTGGIVDDRFIYLSLPGFSLFLLGVGLLGLTVPLATHALGLVATVGAGLVAAVGAVLSVWGLFARSVPGWAKPR